MTDQADFVQHISDGYVELVDVMPTLADYAGIGIPALCPQRPGCTQEGCSSDSTMIRHCTEGQSLRPIVEKCASGTNCDEAKSAAFSVYPHYGRNNQWHQSTGYSMTTKYQGREYRYTEWVPFDTTNMMSWHMPDYNPGRFDDVQMWCDNNGEVGSPGCDGERGTSLVST